MHIWYCGCGSELCIYGIVGVAVSATYMHDIVGVAVRGTYNMVWWVWQCVLHGMVGVAVGGSRPSSVSPFVVCASP